MLADDTREALDDLLKKIKKAEFDTSRTEESNRGSQEELEKYRNKITDLSKKLEPLKIVLGRLRKDIKNRVGGWRKESYFGASTQNKEYSFLGYLESSYAPLLRFIEQCMDHTETVSDTSSYLNLNISNRKITGMQLEINMANERLRSLHEKQKEQDGGKQNEIRGEQIFELEMKVRRLEHDLRANEDNAKTENISSNIARMKTINEAMLRLYQKLFEMPSIAAEIMREREKYYNNLQAKFFPDYSERPITTHPNESSSTVPPVPFGQNGPMYMHFVLEFIENLPQYAYIFNEKKKDPKKKLDADKVKRHAKKIVEMSSKELMPLMGNTEEPDKVGGYIIDDISNLVSIIGALRQDIEDNVKKFLSVLNIYDASYFENKPPELQQIIDYVKQVDFSKLCKIQEDYKTKLGRAERSYIIFMIEAINAFTNSWPKILAKKEGEVEKTEMEEFSVKTVENIIMLREKALDGLRGSHKEKAHERAKREKRGKGNEFYVASSGPYQEIIFEREPPPEVKYRDVVGKSFETLRVHIEDLAKYAYFQNLFTATSPRGKVKSNMLIIGPYGCGKTEIARAMAGDPRFIAAEVSISNLLSFWFGQFERNVDNLWREAYQLRKDSGFDKLVLLMMDEFDSWFNPTQGNWVDSTYKRVQKAVQMKLDGITEYDGIIATGMTNEPAKIPMAIIRRFKYVDIVGELDHNERITLVRRFLSKMPLSSGFRQTHYNSWAEMLDGATGDVVGKVMDNLHYEFMREFIKGHKQVGKKLEGYLKKTPKPKWDIIHIKQQIQPYMKVDPYWLNVHIKKTLADPVIRDQIKDAQRVYQEAHTIMRSMGTQTHDHAAPYRPRHNGKVVELKPESDKG